MNVDDSFLNALRIAGFCQREAKHIAISIYLNGGHDTYFLLHFIAQSLRLKNLTSSCNFGGSPVMLANNFWMLENVNLCLVFDHEHVWDVCSDLKVYAFV